MREIKVLPALRRALDRLFHEGRIFRMRALENELHGRFRRWIVLEDSKGFLRPVELVGGSPPAETSRMTESLSFRQVRLTTPELLGQILMLGHVQRGADESLEAPLIEARDPNPPDMSKLAV